MKPTCNSNDLYQVGNDYPQVASTFFETSSYADGIYTELVDDFNAAAGTNASGDTFFDLKAADGINKRILNVPQDKWAEVSGAFSGEAIFSDDYATAEVVSGVVAE